MHLDEKLVIKPLGAGNEVGRSCIHLKYQDKQLLLDCGVHPAYTGVSSLPFLDLVDLGKIDAVLITHFHLDHAASLPFLTEKTDFKGKVYMTHPTKAILKWLLNDYIRIINSASDEDFYSEKDLENCYNKIIPIDYHQVIDISGIKLTALNAGHVLGAAMFLLEIEQTKLLYTGDFSREDDRHLKGAESPNCKLDVLITESTYGTQCHLPRTERETRFTKIVSNVVQRGGKCLLPVFALGRAQEILLILEEHWEENPKLKKYPIYYASALAKKCMTVYQTYVNMMNERMQKISLSRNPFDFKNIENIKDIKQVKEGGPCVVMASPGMLQSGLSRELFERWCGDSKNAVVIAGYCVDGTLAKEILKEPKEIESSRGQMLKLNMTVEYISFSAHVDFTQNSQFIYECMPNHLFFVHGETNEMHRLKATIQARNEKKDIEMQLYALKNGEEASIDIPRADKAILHTSKKEFTAVAVKEGRNVEIYDKEEIYKGEAKTDFRKINFTQRLKVSYNLTPEIVKKLIVSDFDAVKEGDLWKIGELSVRLEKNEILLEWTNSYYCDVIAMTLQKTIKEIANTTKSIKLAKETQIENTVEALKGYFKDVKLQKNKIIIDEKATIIGDEVETEDLELKERIEKIYKRVESLYHDH
ncbi:hypothetical protein NUSPORA_00097 [Nucleospora cyclopteri]